MTLSTHKQSDLLVWHLRSIPTSPHPAIPSWSPELLVWGVGPATHVLSLSFEPTCLLSLTFDLVFSPWMLREALVAWLYCALQVLKARPHPSAKRMPTHFIEILALLQLSGPAPAASLRHTCVRILSLSCLG